MQSTVVVNSMSFLITVIRKIAKYYPYLGYGTSSNWSAL